MPAIADAGVLQVLPKAVRRNPADHALAFQDLDRDPCVAPRPPDPPAYGLRPGQAVQPAREFFLLKQFVTVRSKPGISADSDEGKIASRLDGLNAWLPTHSV